MAFAIKEQPKMVEKGACKICGRYGHEESVCYEVIRYHPAGVTVAKTTKEAEVRLKEGGVRLQLLFKRTGYISCHQAQQFWASLASQAQLQEEVPRLRPRGSPNRSPAEYVDRGSPVAQQCQPDLNEGGTAATQKGEEPSASKIATPTQEMINEWEKEASAKGSLEMQSLELPLVVAFKKGGEFSSSFENK
ncbi:hypothetical protein Cgig2_026704 [Carnegiea gigantea]|uniref:Uncharacterized protein n=1 Tax=Carnegiea gigantea TaxID=171969 RepID=A0A9Q1Q5J5_9CARY|nr:hypothetical protein Cgig2_026704 [Carnegiea gigantea]